MGYTKQLRWSFTYLMVSYTYEYRLADQSYNLQAEDQIICFNITKDHCIVRLSLVVARSVARSYGRSIRVILKQYMN